MLAAIGVLVAAAAANGTALGAQPAVHAPPMLSPSSANSVARACRRAEPYADTLVVGATLAEATSAESILERCAKSASGDAAKAVALALGAADFSQGWLENDTTLMTRAAEATSALRAAVPASDEQIRGWAIVPDSYDRQSGHAYFNDFDCRGSVDVNAAYINLAARLGEAWIRQARTERKFTGCMPPPLGSPRYGDIGSNATPYVDPSTVQTPDAVLTRPPGPP